MGMTMLRKNFRFNLESMLDTAGRGSRSQLARYLGVSPAFVSQLISGDVEPSLERVEEIAAFFGIHDVEMFSTPRAISKPSRN